jgi:outer membrane protein assembly factor BamB
MIREGARLQRIVGVGIALAVMVAAGSYTARIVEAKTPAVNWSQWGFDAQHNGDNASETVLGAATIGHLIGAFSTPLAEDGGDPIVQGGVAYISDAPDGTVQAIDATTGAVMWTQNACNSGEETSDPAFASGRVWVGLNDPGVAGISSSGGHISCIEARDYFSAPPSTAQGTVYAGGQDGVLLAINAATGAIRWSHTFADARAVASPTLSTDDHYLFVTGNGTRENVTKLDAATGAVIWSRSLETSANCGEPALAVSGTVVYVGGCGLEALNASSGAIIWHASGFGSYVPTPAIAGGLVVATRYGAGGVVDIAAFDATTGTRAWRTALAAETSPADASPTIANGVVYVNNGSSVAMLKLGTGAPLGVISLPRSVTVEGAVIPVDGRVYFCAYNSTSAENVLDAYKP